MSVYVDAELLNVLEPADDGALSASAAAGAGSYNKQGLTLLSLEETKCRAGVKTVRFYLVPHRLLFCSEVSQNRLQRPLLLLHLCCVCTELLQVLQGMLGHEQTVNMK